MDENGEPDLVVPNAFSIQSCHFPTPSLRQHNARSLLSKSSQRAFFALARRVEPAQGRLHGTNADLMPAELEGVCRNTLTNPVAKGVDETETRPQQPSMPVSRDPGQYDDHVILPSLSSSNSLPRCGSSFPTNFSFLQVHFANDRFALHNISATRHTSPDYLNILSGEL